MKATWKLETGLHSSILTVCGDRKDFTEIKIVVYMENIKLIRQPTVNKKPSYRCSQPYCLTTHEATSLTFRGHLTSSVMWPFDSS